MDRNDRVWIFLMFMTVLLTQMDSNKYVIIGIFTIAVVTYTINTYFKKEDI